jgi:putative transposase
MTLKKHDSQADSNGQDEFHGLLKEKLRWAVRITLVEVLEDEVEALVGAGRYQRTDQRRDYRNGHYTRDLGTSVGQIVDLPVPRTRSGFRTQLFERYQRRQAELDEAIGDMFIRGVSTEGVGQVVEVLTGSRPSPSTVSRVFHSLEDEFEAWKKRPLQESYLYAFADGTYFTVIYDHEGTKMPILAVIGINDKGERDVLAFTIGECENQSAWEGLLDDLKERGLKELGLWVSDGHKAMLNALEAKFPGTPRQRCVKHKMENVLGYVPKKQRDQLLPELRAIFYQDSREKAEQEVAAFCAKYESLYPSAVECLRRDLGACLTFYAFPEVHWRTIRTSNIIERLFHEVKRRSHKMGAAFRNEGSCLLMFYAVIRTLRFHNIPMPKGQPALLHTS